MAKRSPRVREIELEGPAAPGGEHLPEGEAAVDLADVLGQDRAVGVLRAALSSGKLSHAWVFSGPMGVGKRTAAEALAAMALDPTLARDLMGVLSVDPNGRIAEMARHRSHADIHLVNKELARFSETPEVRTRKQRSIPIEVLRERVIKPATLAPAESGGGLMRKAFIVDEAELMAETAQNALLKTLEEPPAGTLLVLVTSREQRLLPTVRSRCNRVAFGLLDEASMAGWVERSGLDVSGAERAWLLGFAEGSPGRYALAARTGLFAWHEALEPMFDEVERGGAAVELGARMAKLVDDWAKAWVEKRPLASKEAANQLALGQMLSLVARRARRAMRTGDIDVLRAVGVIESVRRAEANANANVHLSFVFEELGAALAG